MKIGEMSADKAFETMAKLAPYIQSITDDEVIRMAKIVRNDDRKSGSLEDAQRSGESFLWSIMPRMIGEHREDVFGIVSVLKECPIEQVEKMTFADLMECLNSAEMFDILPFFRFAVRVSVSI